MMAEGGEEGPYSSAPTVAASGPPERIQLNMAWLKTMPPNTAGGVSKIITLVIFIFGRNFHKKFH